MGKSLILLGYMGSGKTLIAAEIARQKGFQYIDLDHFIEEKEQQTIPEIFAQKGEIYFRKIERNYLEEVLKFETPFVLSVGGGTPCYGNAMELINQNSNAISIYLSANVEALTQRLFSEKQNRPLISHLQTQEELNDFIRKHLFERSFYYNQAKMIVKTDGKSVIEIVDEIAKNLF